MTATPYTRAVAPTPPSVPLPAGSHGVTVREEFDAREVATTAETASAAVASQAAAAIQARYLMALKNPRDMDVVRERLLKECRRPGFAQVARYHKPIGKGIEGPSIRFAEAALRAMGNVLPEVSTVFDDQSKRIVRVAVTDLETNVTYARDVTVDKCVERRAPREGQTVVSVRTNSQGQRTYMVLATEDDLLNKEGALVSKALRTLALRILPGDLLDEGMALVTATLASRATADPAAERKRHLDAFAAIGVSPADLKRYLGHDLTVMPAADAAHLTALYWSIMDGETTWAEAMAARHPEPRAAGENGAAPTAARGVAKAASALAAAAGAPPQGTPRRAPSPMPAPQGPPVEAAPPGDLPPESMLSDIEIAEREKPGQGAGSVAKEGRR